MAWAKQPSREAPKLYGRFPLNENTRDSSRSSVKFRTHPSKNGTPARTIIRQRVTSSSDWIVVAKHHFAPKWNKWLTLLKKKTSVCRFAQVISILLTGRIWQHCLRVWKCEERNKQPVSWLISSHQGQLGMSDEKLCEWVANRVNDHFLSLAATTMIFVREIGAILLEPVGRSSESP